MAKKYEFVNEQEEIKYLRDTMDELVDNLDDLRDDHYLLEYMSDFIRYKGLQEEFEYFKENATKDPHPELPFPHYEL
jgi:uncharacterized protein (UPF0305 family)